MRVKTVIPRAQAIRDVDDAIAWYLNEDAKAAPIGFIDALQVTYSHLGRHPSSGSLRYAHELNLPGLCGWPLDRFPYLVFYVEHPDHIDVWRVLHRARDIPAWMQTPDQE